ncbi:glycosyltransferase family 2 protein [Flavobacterium anhuiense]|uniref:glycosyltransferase family 2 protein n=1 Tax=Flavobacterium anhuiense TaxID=459526 RepID=UPI003D98B306
MITLVLTNRNRNLHIVKKCLDSLEQQTEKDFKLFFVDYGSDEEYFLELEKLIFEYSKILFIKCSVSGQLWNKSRAINIALKKCTTDFFFVGDIDMLFHTDFVRKLYKLKKEKSVIYFQVGFLNEEETKLDKDFFNSNVSFVSQKEATGMTLYPAKLLREINGYDEFYHGWGAEDTDVHIRLQNSGIEVEFYNHETLLKHQWHPKNYRSKNSAQPFHFNLEKVNHSYISFSQITKRTLVNVNIDWGVMPDESHYLKLLQDPDFIIEILPEKAKIDGFISQMSNFKNKIISFVIKDPIPSNKIKQEVKKVFGKKSLEFLSLEKVNDMILQEIVIHYRNLPYKYFFDQKKKEIQLKIYFP